jgi:hypothetical protein
MMGLKKLPDWLKEAYLKAVNNTCEECGQIETKEDPLEVHRIIRGNEGGTYRPGNVKIIHKSEHDIYHSNEFPNCKSK